MIEIVWCALVGAFWGFTNPLLNKEGNKSIQRTNQDKNANPVINIANEILALLQNWRFLLPFLINQLGSILFNYRLGKSQLSIVIPLCSAFNVMFTALSSYILQQEEKRIRITDIIGASLILIGITISMQ